MSLGGWRRHRRFWWPGRTTSQLTLAVRRGLVAWALAHAVRYCRAVHALIVSGRGMSRRIWWPSRTTSQLTLAVRRGLVAWALAHAVRFECMPVVEDYGCAFSDNKYQENIY